MSDINYNFFWLPKEVIYYVVIPMILILVAYSIFSLVYRKKKGTKYYNYIVDYVYSTLGIIFCGQLFCLLFGYSIATMQILIVNRILNDYILLAVILVILPIIPTFFLVYVTIIYLKNLKRKEKIDNNEEIKLIKKNS
ncbi:MAG: hypothetical protein IKN63_06795 [Bacilli bacterium]|nr:hypothetical protein [Bacilli bacterium]